MNLEHLAKRLEANSIGAEIFTDFMPADAKKGVLLRLPLSGVRIDHNLPGYYKTQVQAIVRAQKHATGTELAKAVQEALTIRQRTEFAIPEMIVLHMLPETKPIIYPRSDGNGIEWSINFRVVYWEE